MLLTSEGTAPPSMEVRHVHSTKKAIRQKPEKPRPDFPLFPHTNGQWVKKIRGRLCYFGAWEDPQAALEKYLDQKEDLHAGRVPRPKGDDEGLTLEALVNKYLAAKKDDVDAGELSGHGQS